MSLKGVIQTIVAVYFSAVVAACGGGGSLSKGSTGGGSSGGGSGGSGGNTDTWAISLTMQDSTGAETRFVSQAKPGTLIATLTKNNVAQKQLLIQFRTELTGELSPTIGTALTDDSGQATITLRPGTVVGAGRAIAEYTPDGGELISATYSFNSAGDQVSPGNGAVNLQVQLQSATTQAAITSIKAAEPALVVVTATNNQNLPIANQVVRFETTLGGFLPSSGTALTDSQGVATILLTAGSVEGASELTVSAGSSQLVQGFYTLGDQVDGSVVQADISFTLLDCPEDWDRTLRNKSQCLTSQNISPSSPGIIYIDVKKAGSNVPLASQLVSATSTIGSIRPETGTAITDANGIALLDLLAGNDVGAGEITVSALTNSSTQAFEIGAANVSLTVDNGLAEGESLSAGATTVIRVNITGTDGQPYLPPLNVEFTSSCASATPALAIIDSNVVSIGGIAQATYRADGCVGTDAITATVVTGGDAKSISTTVPVIESQTGSIEFVSASTNSIVLKGTGGVGRTETAVLQFRVRDENGNPDPQEYVRFQLSTEVGELQLEPAEAYSNNEGLVQTVIRSGRVPGVVRVVAIHGQEDGNPDNANNRISSVSDLLTISTGLPDNDSFTVSPEHLNVEGLDYNGVNSNVTVFLADHQNNPVPDGTSIYFQTEGGAIQPSCNTTQGKCTVTWNSQNPRPFTLSAYENSISFKCDRFFGAPAPCTLGIRNSDGTIDHPLGGRATVLAFAVGEENFVDLNSNGVFDIGEFNDTYDLSEAFIDHNENGQFDGVDCNSAGDPCAPLNSGGGEFEEFEDFNSDGLLTAPNGMYNGRLCSEVAQQAGACTTDLLHVRQNIEIVMSGSEAFVRFITPNTGNASCTSVIANDGSERVLLELEPSDLSGFCDVNLIDLSNYSGVTNTITEVPVRIVYSDRYNNPLPYETSITVNASNGILTGEVANTVASSNSIVPSQLSVVIARETVGNSISSGSVKVVFTTPKGVSSTHVLNVRDDR